MPSREKFSKVFHPTKGRQALCCASLRHACPPERSSARYSTPPRDVKLCAVPLYAMHALPREVQQGIPPHQGTSSSVLCLSTPCMPSREKFSKVFHPTKGRQALCCASLRHACPPERSSARYSTPPRDVKLC